MLPVDRFLLHCSLIDGVGPATVQPLLDNLRQNGEGAVEALYHCSMKDFVYQYHIQARSAALLASGLEDMTKLEGECIALEREHIAWISILDPRYPDYLRNTHLPPIGLYVQGNAELLCKQCLVACVGSRDLNEYGEIAARRIVGELVTLGAIVVSGGARGIDTIVHRTVLQAKGQTIAILGSGLCEPYPAQNKNLFESICAHGGALVSPFPLYMRAIPGNFPARNRIIAGISHATLVIQAALQSGALITAAYALEAGREVGAVPGRIDDPLAAGCHQLFTQGALVVTSGKSVLQALGHDIALYRQKEIIPTRDQLLIVDRVEKNIKKEIPAKSIAIDTGTIDTGNLIYICKQPRLFDELYTVGTWSSESALREELWKLCIQGEIEQNFMGQWCSIIKKPL